jgi:hypothetical protein
VLETSYKGAKNVQQDEQSIEMRIAAANAAAAANFAFLKDIDAIFANALGRMIEADAFRYSRPALERLKADVEAGDWTDTHSGDAADRGALRDAQRAEWTEEGGF